MARPRPTHHADGAPLHDEDRCPECDSDDVTVRADRYAAILDCDECGHHQEWGNL